MGNRQTLEGLTSGRCLNLYAGIPVRKLPQRGGDANRD